MRTIVFSLAAFSTALAAAQAPSPRAGRAMSLTAEAPIVWLGPRTAWAPLGEGELTACNASRCAPVVSHTTCAVPACPGSGSVLTVATDVAPVGAWPADLGGFEREQEILHHDAQLVALQPYLGFHPDAGRATYAREAAEQAQQRERDYQRESVRWVSDYRSNDRWELGVGMALATLANVGGSYSGPAASLALLHVADHDMADDGGDAGILGAFLGDTFGLELRARTLFRMDSGQQAHWIAAVGFAPMLENRWQRTVVRMPSLMGVLIPEIGAIFREDRALTWYVTWDAAFSILLDHMLAVELRPEVTVVDDWIPRPPDIPRATDPVEVITTLYVGLRVL